MKPTRILLLLAVSIPAILYSCKKDTVGDPNDHLLKPDLTINKVTDVTGFVTDENNEPVAGVLVKAGNKTTTTDEYGYFTVSQVSLPEVAGFVKMTKAGYFDNYRTFSVSEQHPGFVRAKLLLKKDAGSLDAAAGGTVTATDGVKISLPAAGVVVADGGASYTGQVHVNVQKIDPNNAADARMTLPGDGRGVNKDNYLTVLKMYASVAVELTGNNGQRLQIATGKQATVSMPVPSALAGVAPSSVSLWSLDETKGLWKQEGEAVKTGSDYVATVSHFSFWSGAVGYPLVNFTARILTPASQPLANVPVMITIANQPLNAGYGQFAYTDANGYINGAILANTSLVLDILTPCATSAYTHPFTTTYSDVDLGNLTGNLGQGMVTISGTVTDCNNAPVTNGYVQTYDNGFYNRINISNGSFSFTGLACTNTAIQVVAVNKAANQQNTPRELTLAPGVNNLGALVACGTSTVGTISYSINGGVTKTFIEPADTLGGFFFAENGGNTAVITLGVAQGATPVLSFQFTGPAQTSGEHKVTEVFSAPFPGGRIWAPAPLTMNITEFGKAGGFIAGNFSGLMLGFSDNSIQNVSCNFRVRRMNQ